MASLCEKLTKITARGFVALDLPPEHGQVQVSGQPEMAQYQCNGALSAAKAAQKNPRDIAQKIIDFIRNEPQSEKVFADLSIGGPGFINIALQEDYIASHLEEAQKSDNFGIETATEGQTIILDYGGPNIAKAMHVGHLRSAIIGDSLRRIYKAASYKTLADVHMGDWGTPMGMLIADYLEQGVDLSGYNTENDGDVLKLMEDMATRYPQAANKFKDDDSFKTKAMEATVLLQSEKQPHHGLWKIMRDVSVKSIKGNFDRLDVSFDLWKGESDAHPYIAPMVEDLKSRELAVESDGALVVSVAMEGDKKEMPPLILYKRDGAVLYGTTDLGTLAQRMKDYHPSKIVYIVDQRQSLHFEQVFRAARKASIVPDDCVLIHAGFGTMNGLDGKPFKTRAGGVMKLEDLIEGAIEKARLRLVEADLAKDTDEKTQEDIAYKVAIAAIKFADLQNNRVADYIFDIDRMTSFEGKTGPYLLYQAVRIKSLLRKANFEVSTKICLQKEDKALALMLCDFPDYFSSALRQNAPHILCDYAFKLAQEFSSFYGNCHILSEQNQDLKASRLSLCALTCNQLEFILGLLGIGVPEKM